MLRCRSAGRKVGEAVKAVVVKVPNSNVSEEEIINHCRKDLAGFKAPKSVDLLTKSPGHLLVRLLRRTTQKYWEGYSTRI